MQGYITSASKNVYGDGKEGGGLAVQVARELKIINGNGCNANGNGWLALLNLGNYSIGYFLTRKVSSSKNCRALREEE